MRAYAQDSAAVPITSLIPAHALMVRYENDLFAGTDRYFTQGVSIEWSSPGLDSATIGAIMPGSRKNRRLTLGINHLAYTPSSIRADSILRGDRPYAAAVFLSLSGTPRARYKRTFFSGVLNLGVIGPAAGGREIQTSIHRATGDAIPQGWQHQIKNDLMLDYSLAYAFSKSSRRALWGAEGKGTLGTANTSASAQVFAGVQLHKKTKNYRLATGVALNFSGMAVGYNASLQGGLFNRRSPYTLSSAEIERLIGGAIASLFVSIQRVTLQYSHHWRTREFEKAAPHAWGALSLRYLW